MRDVLALLTAGAGVFSVGLHLVSTAMRESASRTLRASIRRTTQGGLSCALVGCVAGAIVQSTSAVVTVLGSMATSGLISVQQALPIVAFANVGTTALVFAGAIDTHVAVMFALGLSGLAFAMATEFRWKAASAVVLGVALLLYGGDLVTQAAAGLQRDAWFSDLLRSSRGSTALAFAIGTLASFLSQSTTAVALLAIALANGGLLGLPEATTMVYGANLGSTIARFLMTQRAHGILLQVSRFQDLFKLSGTVLFLALFIVERATDLPLVQALVGRLSNRPSLQLALVNLLFNSSMALIAAAFRDPIERFVTSRWQGSITEALSVPEYISLDATDDPATAIDLLEREQMRILKRTRDYLAAARAVAPAEAGAHAAPEHGPLSRLDPAAVHRSFLILFNDIEHFHSVLIGKHLDVRTSNRLGNVHGRQKLLELVEDSLQQMSAVIVASPPGGKLETLTSHFVEALDFLLMFACDAARTLERGRAELLLELTGDRSDMMGEIRTVHMAPDQALTADERATVLRLTTLFERSVWMLQRYADLLLRNIESESPALATATGLVADPDGLAPSATPSDTMGLHASPD